jgi:YidC/Oxa1 family membrane protein insertase
MLRAIETALGTALAFFFDLVPSFGVAIIMLTVAVNILVFPLTLKQTRSTRAFQAIQPDIRRIQKEFKDDPEAMQKELMRVQREAGASPGGCVLPLIVQFPIWIALFRLLSEISNIASGAAATTALLPEGSALLAAVQEGRTQFLGMELGNTINQGVTGGTVLGAIPYILMIVIMVASQYFQQWHATRGISQNLEGMSEQQRQQQRTQQTITRFMPLVIGVVSWNFPAGLAVYWATGNLFRLGQQFAIFAIDGRPTPPALTADTGNGKNEGGKGSATGRGEAGSGNRTGDDTSPAKPSRPHPVSEKKRRRRRR